MDNKTAQSHSDSIDECQEELYEIVEPLYPVKKSDALNRLKDHAVKYLSLVNHASKFQVECVEKVLTQSISQNVDFDPRRAAGAFEHLARYGQNLIEQPWREEFKTLFLSSGYYIHKIQRHLCDPHEILLTMGYTSVDDEKLQLKTESNSSDLKKISRDCLLASQECLIIGQILDLVQSETKENNFPPSQVYMYRKDYDGGVTAMGRRICLDIEKLKDFSDEPHKFTVDKSCENVPPEIDDRMEVDCPSLGAAEPLDAARNKMKGIDDIPERETQVKQKHRSSSSSSTNEDFYTPAAKSHMSTLFLSPNSPSINSPTAFVFPPASNDSYASDQKDNNISTSPSHDDQRRPYSNINAARRSAYFNGSIIPLGSNPHDSSTLVKSEVALEKSKISQDELLAFFPATTDKSIQNQHEVITDWIGKSKSQQQQVGTSSKVRPRHSFGSHSQNTPNASATSTSSKDPGSEMIQEALKYKGGVNHSFAVKGRKSMSALESTSSPYCHKPKFERLEERELYDVVDSERGGKLIGEDTNDENFSSQNANSPGFKGIKSEPDTFTPSGKKKKNKKRHGQRQGGVVVLTEWTCSLCTFINYKTMKDVCDMCGTMYECPPTPVFSFEDSDSKYDIVQTPSMPKLYSTPQDDNNNGKKSMFSYASAVKNESRSSRSGVGANKKEEEMIHCPTCTVLNPKLSVTCSCCQSGLYPMKRY